MCVRQKMSNISPVFKLDTQILFIYLFVSLRHAQEYLTYRSASMDSHENPLVEKVKRRYAKLRLQRHQRFYISVCSTNPVPFFDVRDLSILYVKGSILLMGSWWKHVNLCTRRTSVAKKQLTNDCLFSLD